MAKRKSKSKSKRARRRAPTRVQFVQVKKRRSRRGSSMAKRKKRRGGFRGKSGRSMGGFFGRETMAAVGGATAAAIAGPIIGRYMPASLGGSTAGKLLGAGLVAAVGFFALRRVSRPAALAFVGASVAPAVAGLIPSAAGISGYGEPDGVSYLPDPNGVSGYLAGPDDDLSGVDDDMTGFDDDLTGMGEFDPAALEV